MKIEMIYIQLSRSSFVKNQIIIHLFYENEKFSPRIVNGMSGKSVNAHKLVMEELEPTQEQRRKKKLMEESVRVKQLCKSHVILRVVHVSYNKGLGSNSG